MSIENTAPETVETIETPASVEGGGTDAPEHGTEPEGGKPAAYTPNYKFKVYDEEKEIPESFRALVKDTATEKEVRELFEKAHGLDGLKPTHQKVVKERDELTTRFKETEGQLHGTVENLKKIHHYSQNDLDTFFKIYKIPEEKLFQYVSSKLKEAELDPAVAESLNAGRQAKLDAEYYKDQVESNQRTAQENFRQQHEFNMTSELGKPEVAQFIKDFDARAGQPGAFQRHINDYGNQVYQTQSGRYAPPSETVAYALKYYRSLLQPNPSQQPASVTSPAEPPPPPIPNVGSGRSASPVKPRFKSLEALRKHAQQVKEQNQEA